MGNRPPFAVPDTQTPLEAASPTLGYAWYVVVVLMLCATLSLFDRQILSLLVAPIKQDLGISDTRIGLLGGLAFALFYALMSIPAGWVADRWSRRTLAAAGIAVWSVMTACCGLATGFWSLFLVRMAVGVGEASLGPAAISLLADYFPRNRLAAAMSVFASGTFLGMGLALIIGGAVIQAVGHTASIELPLVGTVGSWRLAFLIVGGPGLLVAAIVYTIREPVRTGVLLSGDGAVARLRGREVLTVLGSRLKSFLGLALGMVFLSMSQYSFVFWAPVYLQRVHGWKPRETGLALGLLVLVFGCLGMYVGGRMTDHWHSKGIRDAPLRLAAAVAVAAGAAFCAGCLSATPAGLLTFAAPATALIALPTGSIFAAQAALFPNQVRGQTFALFMLLLNLGGLSIGPLLPGLLGDYVFHDEMKLGPALALATTVTAWLAALVFWRTRSIYTLHHQLQNPAAYG